MNEATRRYLSFARRQIEIDLANARQLADEGRRRLTDATKRIEESENAIREIDQLLAVQQET